MPFAIARLPNTILKQSAAETKITAAMKSSEVEKVRVSSAVKFAVKLNDIKEGTHAYSCTYLSYMLYAQQHCSRRLSPAERVVFIYLLVYASTII